MADVDWSIHNFLDNYFSSPIRTLCESIKDSERQFQSISSHDVVEAYNVLCCRIRSRKDDVAGLHSPAFLSIFKDNSTLLVQRMSRDIRGVVANPFGSRLRHEELSMNQSYDLDCSPDEENLLDATNHMLCQYALRLLSDIFIHPSLYSTLSRGQISFLFQDAVSLCTTAKSIFNIERLCCVALLMLRTQQLPLSILQSEAPVLVTALRSALTNEQGFVMGKLDAFRAIRSVTVRHPVLIRCFVPLVPLIMAQLNADVLDVRLEAVFTLSAFAFSKFSSSSTSAFPCYEIAERIIKYVEEQSLRYKALPPDNLLPAIVKSAFSDGDRQFWQRKGLFFGISFASAISVLLDYRIFTSPRLLKLVFLVLAQVAGGKRRNDAAHTEMWKILIWAFSRIPTGEQHLEDRMAQEQNLEGWNKTREKAYRLLKQEVKNGLGVSLVKVLLRRVRHGRRDSRDVEKAIAMIGDLLVHGEDGSKRDAVLMLDRLMSGIGAPPLSRAAKEVEFEIVFSKDLFNGALLGKHWREFTVQPTIVAVEDIHPLCEEEVSAFWDQLAKYWASIVQDLLLHLDDNFPLNIIQIWQSLLLVQSQLTHSHQHLTAQPSFAVHIASVLSGFTTPLESPRVQARYLTIILKLWSVVKNVFTKSWLSFPAEKILASLLRKKFDISNEDVKNIWSRLCAELVSTGIPTLLHVLHTRSLNRCQEEKEVTRCLWRVMAGNGEQLADDDQNVDAIQDDWMDLVHLLVMPFGSWDMSALELELWDATLLRAITAGAKASRARHEVVSIVLDVFGDRLHLLKDVPKVFRCLLSHLIEAPCTTTAFKFLSVLDDFLESSYFCFSGSKGDALDCLRLLGRLILHKFDTMKLLSAMPIGLCKWLADEEGILAEDEHQEMITTIYASSLEQLSVVELSLNDLRLLANFLHSAFVRVHTAGLMSFQKFWRSTYHQRQDISKQDYPLAIRASLKAWSDVCDDSLADDVSLGSESQSLESYTIPDSQPSSEEEVDVIYGFMCQEEKFDVAEANRVTDADDESSQGTVTPRAREDSLVVPPSDHWGDDVEESNALHAIQHGYQSGQDNTVSQKCAEEHLRSAPSWSRPNLRRQHSNIEDVPRTPKRRRTDFDYVLGPSHLDKSASLSGTKSCAQVSVSVPVTRAPSLALLPPYSHSQPSRQPRDNKRRRDETPSWRGSENGLRERDNIDDRSYDKGATPSSDDYDCWERGVLTGELHDETEPENGLSDDPMTDPASGIILSPLLRQFPMRSKRRDRSQSAPEPSTMLESESMSIPQTLRRHQTSPLEHKKTSAQLDALQRAYAIVTDTGASQVDVQDIMHAWRLANQINQVLDEQMYLKFGAHKDGA